MKFNATFADSPSGSLGGITASRNRYGSYLRQKVVPVNPNSTRQQAYRSAFGSAVQYWTSTLSGAQRVAWGTYADNVTFLDSLGNAINLTGQQAFLRTTVARLGAGLSVVAAAPTIYNTGEPITGIEDLETSTLGQIGVDATASTLNTEFKVPAGCSDDGDVLVYLGTPQNASINFFKGPYQRADAPLAIASSATALQWVTDITTLLMAVGLVDGQYRGLRARIAYDDGRLSQSFEVLANVVFTAP